MQGNLREALKSKVLVAYLTAGDPYVNSEIVDVLSECGVDIFEFGIPTVKPKYDGLTIRASYKRALRNGATVEKSFSLIKNFQLVHKVVFTYFELAKAVGLENFMEYVSNAGAEGILFPDLLIEYMEELETYLRLCMKHDFDPMFFITSTFPHKMVSKLAQLNPAFIYLGLMASTGTFLPITVTKAIKIMKGLAGDTPLLVGFAINEPSQVSDYVKAGADGVVVGSAILKLINNGQNMRLKKEKLAKFVRSLKEALEA
ncbi:MAG: tryptophan synthase subunit alpha [Candidatus Bathyarchaeia archaeon]